MDNGKIRLAVNVSEKTQQFSKSGSLVRVERDQVVAFDDVASGGVLPEGFEEFEAIDRYIPDPRAPGMAGPPARPKLPFSKASRSDRALEAKLEARTVPLPPDQPEADKPSESTPTPTGSGATLS